MSRVSTMGEASFRRHVTALQTELNTQQWLMSLCSDQQD